MIDVLGHWICADVGDVMLGEVVRFEQGGVKTLEAEVVGFEQGRVLLMPYADPAGLRSGARAVPTGSTLTIRCGKNLRGVVLDGLGRPYMDPQGRYEASATEDLVVEQPPLGPQDLQPISTPLAIGTRAIDGCITLGEGQKIGLYAGPGVGKLTLLGRIACHSSADVVVVHLHEPLRAILDFFHGELEEEGLGRSVVVATQPTDPAITRVRGAFVAHRVAEYFRDCGLKVLLLLDNLRDVAEAQQEISARLGEAREDAAFSSPVSRTLAKLLGRVGNSTRGSITAIYSVSMLPEMPQNEALASFSRSMLDGHIILNRELGRRNHWPAIDVPVSLSRRMNAIVPARHKELAQKLRQTLALYEKHREAVEAGTYIRGRDAAADEAIERIDAVNGFLKQGLHEKSPLEETVDALEAIFGK
jgi:FliI/YscN family ATPase